MTEEKVKKTKKEKTATKAEEKEHHTFQAETKELLNLMINSLYTHKEIFLRELVSNSSDAMDKLNFQALTKPELMENDGELKIILDVDKEAKTLTVSDNGTGMTFDEVIQNIGTIAKSGSQAFLKSLKEKDDVELIGKFGVGFYSCFMVSKRVVLTTRAAGKKGGTRWESTGDGTYTIEKTDKKERGTEIVLYLRDEVTDSSNPEEDFSNQYTIQNLIKKYSDYIRYPIEMDFHREEYPKNKDGTYIKDAKPEIIIDHKVLNSQTPIWEKNKKDITEDEYFQFYKHHFHDWNEFADVIHAKAEGTIQYTTLLFVPSRAPSNLYDKNYTQGIHLYSNHVFVMRDCKDLLPDHLRFVRGLVDSPDFSLNISREILQHDQQLKVIGKNLEKKVLDALAGLLKNKREKYEEMWAEFGKAIKGGIYMAYKNKEKLQDLVLFPSSYSAGKLTTLREYVERMPKGQEEIYFASGKDIDSIQRMPQLEAFKAKDIEILYFVDKIDEFLTQNLDDYDGKKLKSITREGFDLDKVLKEKGKEEAAVDKKKKDEKEKAEVTDEFSEKTKKFEDLLRTIKIHLGDKVNDVRLSKRLTTSPVCLVATNSGVTFNMEMLMKSAKQITPRASKILEINPNHKILGVLEKLHREDPNSAKIKNASNILFYQAMLIEGYELENPVEFSSQMAELLVEAYK
ncbi:MAG TPA: molecular chaperone HtpG [Candidatus Deferrimicrobium sp.]|nr:molecular chaperone HtpG [Candidatus Deferrimicrobium sp.]